MTAPTITVCVGHDGTTATWNVTDALAVAAQILAQAGPHVYARTDLTQAALLLGKVETEEVRSVAIQRRSMNGRRPVNAA